MEHRKQQTFEQRTSLSDIVNTRDNSEVLYHENVDRFKLEERVLQRLRKDAAACDLLLSLFSASLFNYRRATVCSPLPSYLLPLHSTRTHHIHELPFSQVVSDETFSFWTNCCLVSRNGILI